MAPKSGKLKRPPQAEQEGTLFTMAAAKKKDEVKAVIKTCDMPPDMEAKAIEAAWYALQAFNQEKEM